jgi:AraC-like DNA-binding protein
MQPEEQQVQPLDGFTVGRTRAPAPHGVPVALRSATRQRVSRGRFAPVTGRPITLVKWIIDGEAAIGVEGRRIKFGPGDVAIYVPSIPHQFWVISDAADMCWFSVDGPLNEEFMLGLELHPGAYSYGGPPPLDIIEQMMNALRDFTLQSQRRGSLLAIQTLYEVADRIRRVGIPSVVRQAQQVIHADFTDAELSVDRIASQLNYHRGSLSRAFHRHTGVTIVDYIAQVRLQHARMLLMNTEQRVSDIAGRCGFREANYFCRWIARHTGLPPSKLRRSTTL